MDLGCQTCNREVCRHRANHLPYRTCLLTRLLEPFFKETWMAISFFPNVIGEYCKWVFKADPQAFGYSAARRVAECYFVFASAQSAVMPRTKC